MSVKAQCSSPARIGWAVFLALGAAVFANVAAFYGISYDGQTAVSWYFLLVTISVAASCAPQSASGHHGKTQREQLYEFWSGDRKPVTA